MSSLTNPLCQPANLALSGSLFTGDSEGSSGSTNSSAANAPLLRLQRVDNEQLQFALSQSFSASSFFSATLSNLSSGRYRAAIVSNAIPSIEQIIDVETTPLLGTYATASVNLSGSTAVAPSSLPAGYNGAFYPQTASASGGFTGTLIVNGTTGVVTVTNAGPIGDYTITVSRLDKLRRRRRQRSRSRSWDRRPRSRQRAARRRVLRSIQHLQRRFRRRSPTAPAIRSAMSS